MILEKMQFCKSLWCVTLWGGLKVIDIEKDVPGLMIIVRRIKVLKTLDMGGLREEKDSAWQQVNVWILVYMVTFHFVWTCKHLCLYVYGRLQVFARPDCQLLQLTVDILQH